MLSKRGEKGLRSKQQEKNTLMEVKYKSGLMWQCEIGVPLKNMHKNPHPVSLFLVDAATLTSLLYTRIMARIIKAAFREMCNQHLQVNQLNSSNQKHRGLPDFKQAFVLFKYPDENLILHPHHHHHHHQFHHLNCLCSPFLDWRYTNILKLQKLWIEKPYKFFFLNLNFIVPLKK